MNTSVLDESVHNYKSKQDTLFLSLDNPFVLQGVMACWIEGLNLPKKTERTVPILTICVSELKTKMGLMGKTGASVISCFVCVGDKFLFVLVIGTRCHSNVTGHRDIETPKRTWGFRHNPRFHFNINDSSMTGHGSCPVVSDSTSANRRFYAAINDSAFWAVNLRTNANKGLMSVVISQYVHRELAWSRPARKRPGPSRQIDRLRWR